MPKPAPAQPPWYRSRTFIIGAASFPLFFTALGIAQNLHHFQTPAGSRYELASRPPTLPRNTLLASHAASVKAPIALTTIIPLCLSFVAPALVPRRPDIISTLGSQLSIIVSRTILLYAVPHRLRLSKILDFSDHIVLFFSQIFPLVLLHVSTAPPRPSPPTFMSNTYWSYTYRVIPSVTAAALSLATMNTAAYYHTPVESLAGLAVAYSSWGVGWAVLNRNR